MLLVVLLVTVTLFGFSVFWGAPYLPSHKKQVQLAFTKLRPLSQKDTVLDLGAGDGIVLQEALNCGARRAIGVEINPLLILIAKWRMRTFGSKVSLKWANMWRLSIPKTVTVVYVFGVGRDMQKLKQLFKKWSIQSKTPFEVIIYGHALPGKKAIRKFGAHRLYQF